MLILFFTLMHMKVYDDVPFWVFQEVSKFINHCNEMKAATVANKDGGHLFVVKTPADSSSGAKK